MEYSNILPGVFHCRPNRFIANVELNGYDAKTPVIVAATLRIDS